MLLISKQFMRKRVVFIWLWRCVQVENFSISWNIMGCFLLATKASSSHIKLADLGIATYVKRGQVYMELLGVRFILFQRCSWAITTRQPMFGVWVSFCKMLDVVITMRHIIDR